MQATARVFLAHPGQYLAQASQTVTVNREKTPAYAYKLSPPITRAEPGSVSASELELEPYHLRSMSMSSHSVPLTAFFHPSRAAASIRNIDL
jgi:hypothetical protein